MKHMGGQITIFVSLIMMCIFAMICVIVESARMAGARWYLNMAASSAMDSVFSQYHRQLWDSYRLLFAEYEGEEELISDFSGFLQPYLETENWYPMELTSVSAEELVRATDDSGVHLEQEILDYMKYGVWNMDFDEAMADSLRDTAREADTVVHVAEIYSGHTKEALELERALQAVSESLARQMQHRDEGESRLRSYDGPAFRRKANNLIQELERMPGLMEAYRKQADYLAQGLQESRAEYNAQKQQCSSRVEALLEQEIREYEEYVLKEGERHQEIEALEARSRQQVLLTEQIIEDALEVERIIDEWEEDEEEDGPDLESLWRPVIRQFGSISIQPLSFAHGVKDSEEERWLHQAEHMYRAGMLEMLVPEGTVLSKKAKVLAGEPSELLADNKRSVPYWKHLLINEYCGAFFSCFGTDHGDGGSDSGGGNEGKEKHVLSYEVEYLLGGKETDQENLSAAVHRLLAIREGLNLIHILSDAGKRAEARNLALAITGLTGLTPLVLLTSFFIMMVWALGESLMDVRGMLDGKKVPLLKSEEDWALDLDGLMDMGQRGEIGTGGGEQGLSYLSWLKILLFMDEIVGQEYRMMDLIQMNIQAEQKSFRLKNGIYQVKLRSRIKGRHVFSSLGFVESIAGEKDPIYPMEAYAERVY